MTTPEPRNPDIAGLQAAYDASTQGEWRLTTYDGGIRFNIKGKKTAYCGTDPNYGEPRRMPDTEADNVFIALAHNEMAALLAYVARLEAALEFYANDNSYIRDNGKRARAVLAATDTPAAGERAGG